jgi:hypothetical protein
LRKIIEKTGNCRQDQSALVRFSAQKHYFEQYHHIRPLEQVRDQHQKGGRCFSAEKGVRRAGVQRAHGPPWLTGNRYKGTLYGIKTTARANFSWADELIGYKYNPIGKEMEWTGEELYCAYGQDVFIRKLFNEKISGKKTPGQKLAEIGAPRFVIEPSRSMVGNAGVTIARIGRVSKTPLGQNIIHLDVGVNCHTFGTAVPEQLHRIEIANHIEIAENFETYVAGNLCFTGDLLCRIKNRLNRTPHRGDYLLLYDTGAYSDFFSSNANSFPRPAKVMVARDGTHRLLEEREGAAEVFRREPSWRKEH